LPVDPLATFLAEATRPGILIVADHETTLILVTHSRDDAFDLARRLIVFDHGRLIADGLLETLSIHPRHAAAVRSLGLGQLIPGVVTALGEAETVFGTVHTAPGTRPGPAMLLMRPDQPRLVGDDDGIEAVVLALELRPPEGREVRRVAVVSVAGNILRVFARERSLSVGGHVRVRIDGECDPIQGT
jgi:ABC-type sulfate/molybdate transport systems ATPase subunit